jgi:hypothetical protein
MARCLCLRTALIFRVGPVYLVHVVWLGAGHLVHLVFRFRAHAVHSFFGLGAGHVVWSWSDLMLYLLLSEMGPGSEQSPAHHVLTGIFRGSFMAAGGPGA